MVYKFDIYNNLLVYNLKDAATAAGTYDLFLFNSYLAKTSTGTGREY